MSYRMIVNPSKPCSGSYGVTNIISDGKLNLQFTQHSQHGGGSSSSSLSLPSSPSSRGLILDGEVIGSVSVKSVTPTVNGQRGDTTTLSIAISGTIPRYNNVFTSDNVAQVANYSALREWAFAS